MVDEAITAVRRGPGIAHADIVRRQAAPVRQEMRNDVAPEIGRRRIAMQEDDRIAFARHPHRPCSVSSTRHALAIRNIFGRDRGVGHRDHSSIPDCRPDAASWSPTPANDNSWCLVASTSKIIMLVSMRLSEKFPVPGEIALLYDFVNSIDLRRYVEQGIAHSAGDELATAPELEAWLRDRGLLRRGAHIEAHDHRDALDLREALRSFLLIAPADRRADAAAGARLNTAAARFPLALNVSQAGGMALEPARPAPASGLGNVLAELYRLAETGRLDRLKLCDFRRMPVDVLRPFQAGEPPMVFLGAVRKPAKDPRLSEPSSKGCRRSGQSLAPPIGGVVSRAVPSGHHCSSLPRRRGLSTGVDEMESPQPETALIVGAGSGLSASLARLFTREGVRVALAARNRRKARRAVRRDRRARLCLRCH